MYENVTFITGDRSASPFSMGLVALEMLRALGNGDQLMTGAENGIEAMVRHLAEEAEVDVIEVPTPPLEGDTRWDERHATIRDTGVKRFVVVHGDPLASHLVASLERVLDDDLHDLSIVTGMSLLPETS